MEAQKPNTPQKPVAAKSAKLKVNTKYVVLKMRSWSLSAVQ